MKLYNINLISEEREALQRLTTTGRHSAQKVLNAMILLKADEGLKDNEISLHLKTSINKIEKVRKRCALEGIEKALNRKKRPPRAPKIDGEAEARLVQLACSEAPAGQRRWSLRLLADMLVELEVVDSISHETVRQRLKKKRAETLVY